MSYEITGEDDTYTVAVTVEDAANVGVPDARVTLYGGGVYYESELTGVDGHVFHTDETPAEGCVECTAYCETCSHEQVGEATGTGSGGYYGIFGDSFVAHRGHEFHIQYDHNVGGQHLIGNCHTGTFTYTGGTVHHDFYVPGTH